MHNGPFTNNSDLMKDNKILIFGGSGSLGNKLIEKYSSTNIIYNFSRDECKHWQMESEYGKKITNIIGDIRNYSKVFETLQRINPNIIIICSALKHIDKCEYAIDESLQTNVMGTKNVLDAVENHNNINLQSVVFISTDKACSPINVYGLCKSLSEKLMVERSMFIKNIKFITVRYGNVLTSRGSIIPILQKHVQSGTKLTLTSDLMTRFLMTLEDSCDLINYGILHGLTGEIIIPDLKSMKIIDLFEIFSEKHGNEIDIIGIRPGEKFDESLINENESIMSYKKDGYYHITPSYLKNNLCDKFCYHSGQNVISKEQLKEYLTEKNLL